MPDQITNLPVQEPSNNSQVSVDPVTASPQPSKRGRGFGWLLACIGLLAIIIIALLVHSHESKKSSSGNTAAVGRTAAVSIDSQGFMPTTLSIHANTTVTWTAEDTGLHIVASNTYPKDDILPGLKSQQLGKNAHYSYNFKKSGTYPYHDDLHPSINGVIVVK